MNAANVLSIVDRMLAEGISLAIIGGHAVNAHGFIRATEDVDILYERTVVSQQKLYSVLQEANAYYIGTEIDPQTGIERTHRATMEYIQGNHLLMLGTDFGYVDIFDFVPAIVGASVAEVIRSAVTINDRPFVSLQWLRRMKAAADRPQDRIDLLNLPPSE